MQLSATQTWEFYLPSVEKCGKEVKPLRDIIKCIECGWTDDRKLSSDFLKSDFYNSERITYEPCFVPR